MNLFNLHKLALNELNTSDGEVLQRSPTNIKEPEGPNTYQQNYYHVTVPFNTFLL